MVNLPHATTSELHCAWNRNVLKLKFPSVYCQLRTLITKVFSSVHLARSRVIDAHYTYPNISKNKFAESRMTLVASYLEDRKRGCGRLNFFWGLPHAVLKYGADKKKQYTVLKPYSLTVSVYDINQVYALAVSWKAINEHHFAAGTSMLAIRPQEKFSRGELTCWSRRMPTCTCRFPFLLQDQSKTTSKEKAAAYYEDCTSW